jgi:hypothetical protein
MCGKSNYLKEYWYFAKYQYRTSIEYDKQKTLRLAGAFSASNKKTATYDVVTA